MGKMKKKRNVVVCIIPFIVNCIINMIVMFRLMKILTNPWVSGAWKVGKAFGVKISMSDLRDILSVVSEWNLISPGILILSVVQLGIMIYVFVLFWQVCNDINAICIKSEGSNGKKSPNYLVVLLLSMITLGIYYLYWVYKQGTRLHDADVKFYQRGMKDTGLTYLLLVFFGNVTLGITTCIFVAKLLNDLNLLSSDTYEQRENSNFSKSQFSGGNTGTEQRELDEDSPTVFEDVWKNQEGQQEGNMECCSGIYQGAVFPVGGEEVVVGRDESCANIVIKNPKISRKHCGVRYDAANASYIVTDYSTNGTFYKNGQKFQKEAPTVCHPGTILVIAQSGNEFLLK